LVHDAAEVRGIGCLLSSYQVTRVEG
jgi:hypothetical protein